MRGAALTVGAFYAHFSSKDELLTQAFNFAMDEMGAVVLDSAAGQSGLVGLSRVAEAYLSCGHLQEPTKGCPLPAAVGESVATESEHLQRLVVYGIETMQSRLCDVSAGSIDGEEALALTIQLIGGQILARATRGTPLSTRILSASLRTANNLIKKEFE